MKVFIIFVLYTALTNAQEIDPLSYFPYKTGDMWEYSWVDLQYPDTLQNFNILDSIDVDGSIYVIQSARFINPILPPALLSDTAIYKIDTSYNVFCLTCSFENQFLYKLNAKKYDQWIAHIYQDSGTIYGYEMVRIIEVWDDNLFGLPTTFKNFIYYYAPDSTDTLGLVRYSTILASNFGLYAKGGGDAVGQIFIKGCIINSVLFGDTTNVVTSVFDLSEIPDQFSLYPNFPNPFNPLTTIKFDLIKSETISLIIYDIMGREIRRLIDNDFYHHGSNKIVWDGRNSGSQLVASGVYYYKLSVSNASKTRSMILIK
ncbi:MAG: T9SS type A sorting domain-containing protein [Ignavibacteriaceae bacterium]|nr:T9SS type A sorting domain-containing protein [Ignavibacteriaceae bacterium]HRQ55735.1 T9SS type A sorting domain-containing protein [Ignavibacteriaceae bacterium]